MTPFGTWTQRLEILVATSINEVLMGGGSSTIEFRNECDAKAFFKLIQQKLERLEIDLKTSISGKKITISAN